MKTMLLIVNPAAGKGTKKAEIIDAIDVFNRSGYFVTVMMTQKRGDATEFAKLYGSEYDIVVCCGGDGTLDETLNGILNIKNGEAPQVGYIPVGTANDVANTLSLPKDPKRAAELIVGGRMLNMDMGFSNGRYFTYIAAFGAFTGASYETPQSLKRKFGHMAYLMSGAKYLTQIKPISLAAEWAEGSLSGEFLFGSVSNSTSVAGVMKLSPDEVQLDDGVFEVMLIRKPANVVDLERIVNGILKKKYDPKYVEFFHTSRIRFSFTQEIAWTFDGESGGKHRELSLNILPSAVKMIVPCKTEKIIKLQEI